MAKLIAVLIVIFLALAVSVVVALIVALPVMWLWNAILPQLFEFSKITFWQAAGMVLLVRLLFGTGNSGSKD